MIEEKTNQSDSEFSHSSWMQKFSIAFRGMLQGIKGGSKNSFVIHVPCGLLVVGLAILLKFSMLSIALLVSCIGLVFVAELINSSIESLSRAVTRELNEDVGVALDVASGAVMAASLTAVVVGVLLFGSRIVEMF